jgi:hypothetical protein
VFPLNESKSSFRVLWPDVGLEGTMNHGWSEAAFRGGHHALDPGGFKSRTELRPSFSGSSWWWTRWGNVPV